MEKVLEFLKDFGKNILKVLKKLILLIWEVLLRIVFAFRDLGVGIWNGIKGLIKLVKKFHKRFVESNIWTKLSHFVMGAGNFANKQFIKGSLFLAIQIIFILFMISSPKVNDTPLGAEAIPNFFTLGEEVGMPVSRENAMLIDNLEEINMNVVVNSTTNETKLVSSKLIDLESDNEDDLEDAKAKLALMVRSVNLVEAMNELGEDSNQLIINPNDGKVYKKNLYKNVVYDNRYGTGDLYGYTTVNPGETVLTTSGSTVFIVNVPRKLNTSNDVTQNELVNSITLSENDADKFITVGAFCNSDEFFEEKDFYTYYIIVEHTNRKAEIIFDDQVFSGAEISYFTYLKEHVQSGVANSFLMMLFGLATFLVIALYLIAWVVNIASSYKAEVDVKEGRKPSTFIEDLKSLLDSRFHMTLLTPALILIAIFTILPTVLMIFIAFTDMNTSAVVSGSVLIEWVNIQNFVDLFGGDAGNEIAREIGQNFGRVLVWTFEWALIATFSCYFGGIFLALLINRKDVKLKKLWRTVFILTIAIPQFITLLIMRNLLIESGPINTMLDKIIPGYEPINFLQQGSGADASTKGIWIARGTVLVVNLYIGIPYTMLMTSGILMNIPSDLYEAATIDGANKWQMFRKITLPYVIFVTTPYLIQSFIGNITSFNTIFLLTGGGPTVAGSGHIAGHTDLLVTWLYKMTIDNYKYNAGSIIGILTFMITASITLICYRNSKAYKEEDTFQ